MHPDDRERARSTVARALTDGRGFVFDERIVRPDGEVRYLRSRGEVVRDDQGRPLKVLGACLDITEQKNSEAALRAAADNLQALTRRLVEAEEAERRRIARELHDRVGQNLSALNINLDLALGAASASPLRQRIEDSVSLVDATLQSIESVMAELRPPLLDEYGLGAALGWYAEEFSHRTGIAVVLRDGKDAAAGLRPEAAVALFRIAQEALNNVAKHAGAKQVSVELACEAEEIVLRVADDGAGFDPAAAARGKRWARGGQRARRRDHRSRERAEIAMAIRILIADDHGVVAEGLKHLVEAQADMEVVACVGDGREAVQQSRDLQPDVVLMDLSMPELNGADATRAILQRDPRCRVIVLSMYSDREYVRRALKAGAAGYVVKRSAAKEVVEAIRAVHAGQRYLSPRVADVVINDYAEERDDPLARLSAREREVLQLLAEGRTGAEIAQRLSLSQKTVETYRARLVEKLGIRDVAGLVRFAIQRGLVSLE